MARNSSSRIQSTPTRRRGVNPLVPIAVLLMLLVAGLFFLASRAKLQPVQPIEVEVPRGAPAK